MAARAQRREYAQLLADCQRVYCEVRLLLVADLVAARMAEYAREPLPSLTRSGCSYLMQACLWAASSLCLIRRPAWACLTAPTLPPVYSGLVSRASIMTGSHPLLALRYSMPTGPAFLKVKHGRTGLPDGASAVRPVLPPVRGG